MFLFFLRGNKYSDTEFALYLASTISRDHAFLFRTTKLADILASVYICICITFALASSSGRALEYSPLRRSTRPEDLTASISSPRPSPLSLTLIKYLRIVGEILFICIPFWLPSWMISQALCHESGITKVSFLSLEHTLGIIQDWWEDVVKF